VRAVPAQAPVYTRWLTKKTVCTTTHKTVLFFTGTRSVVVTPTRLRARFQTRWAPSFKTIHKLYNQFKNDGSVLERKCRQPASVHSQENIGAVRVALQRSPSKSTRGGRNTTRNFQTIGAMNIEELFEFVSIQNNSVAKTYSSKQTYKNGIC
jgi:hypothetical protein